ncbi:PLP-dependent aminotransferase family protein [Undibacterium rugosum]|uniref:PLP-dependent aminotransferase family protein n=1 Tax=Undibacterium rugosum TaxID=2762291 RepID=A0A923I2K4_9BURK|nr:PLP-dependent aminotransferase family protein [Undibacterium rugosum]MBC3935912.1 PLP-dependent aminotransferase family protein [Undibacterium rugosum]MBR7779305.1 PLP-dependent aminotransferase family protein [Undibacterium rugosum]
MQTFNLSDYLLQYLDKTSATPRNRQLYRLLRQAILDRVLPADTRLPSSRDLASELLISRNTVLYAYEQLLAEGYVEARTGSGTFVANTVPDAIYLPVESAVRKKSGASKAQLSQRGHRLVAQAAAAPRQWGAFVPGVPDVTQFPHRVWNSLQSKIWRKPAISVLTYGQGGGHQGLREAVAEYLKVSRSVACEADQVVITNGIHQSIDLCLRLLSDPGDVAWVEDPCYWGARNLLAASGVRLRPVRVDAEGICPDAADLAEVPRFIFVTPSHQYPLGMVMSLARRRSLLEYARQHGCWIIEDDYDSEFRYGGRPLASLQGMDSAERVLYMGTFSKTMFPGLRLGYLVLPAILSQSFVTGMEELHRSGQASLQATMAEFMTQGHFNSHIRRMRLLYGARLEILQQEITRHFELSQVCAVGSDAGLHLTLRLPAQCDDRQIAREALAQGIAVRPLSSYYQDASHTESGLVLGYACVEEARIAPAFALLAAVIRLHL